MSTAQPLGHFINGIEIPSVSGATFETINPATGEVIRAVAYGESEDVDAAVAAARRTFEKRVWQDLVPTERARRLRRIGELMLERIDEFVELESSDCGSPLSKARNDVLGSADIFRYFSQFPEHIEGRVYASDPSRFIYSGREPYGVVAAISPWNFPLVTVSMKVAAALAMANSIVVKMAEQTPLSTSLLAEVAAAAGVPDGVLNVVHGDGRTGAALVAHPDVAMVTFTGSTAVGKSIARAAAADMKGVHLELGGKSANIIFDDADLDSAVQGALYTSFFNTGQVCTSAARILVQNGIADEFIAEMSKRMSALRVGDPRDIATHLGPIVSKKQQEAVLGYLQSGLAEGATLLGQTSLPEDPRLAGGFFVAPSLLGNINAGMRVSREEIFGPISTVTRFADETEAVALSNDTKYGLSTSMFTQDAGRAMRLSNRLQAGIIWVNCPNTGSANIPYEGHKMSGLGVDKGLECITTFTQLKVRHIQYDGSSRQWHNGDFFT